MKIECPLLFAVCIFLSINSHAQMASYSISGKSIPELTQENKEEVAIPLFNSSSKISLEKEKPTLPSLRQFFSNPLSVSEVPKAYSYNDLGFFCKLEVQMEKRAKFPVKVRLGEVQYVERMEGKLE